MNTKSIIITIILTLSIGTNLVQYLNQKPLQLEIATSNEALNLCDQESQKLEKKLSSAYLLINEYEVVFPASFMKETAIDDSKIKEYGDLLK